MKKVLIVSISLLLTLCLVAVAAGCGGDTSKAKEYMDKGDELSKKSFSVPGFSEDMDTTDITVILTDLGLDLTAASMGDWESSASEVTTEIDGMISDANSAQDEYEKILGLNDVDDYQQYAQLMIKALENYITVLEGLQDLINQLGKALSEGESLSDAATAWYKENKSVQTALVKALGYWGEATLYKNQKNLDE